MGSAEMIEREVKKHGGKYAEEIISLVRELAAIDTSIKEELDEIEPLDEEKVQRHNELARRIDELIGKAINEDSDQVDSSNGTDCDVTIRLEIHVFE